MKRDIKLPLWPLGFVALGLVGYAISGLSARVVLYDARLFYDRASRIVDGNWPYFDTVYEHLPLALPPMLGPRLLVGPDAFVAYSLLFGAAMMACLLLAARWIRLNGEAAGIDAPAEKWALMAAPLVPLVTFRVDPLPVLLAALAFYLSFVAQRRSALWAGLAGIAAKGWPVVLAPVEWWAGRRRRAIVLAGFTVVLVGGLLLTPGFQEGRAFGGVHLETISGSALAFFRTLVGTDDGIFATAGAFYVRAPGAAIAINAALGVGVIWATRAMWRWPVTVKSAGRIVAVLTAGMLLASPLLSAQFLLWLTPWLIFFDRKRVLQIFVATATLTLVLILQWSLASLWWQSGLLARNGLLVLLVWELIKCVRNPTLHDRSPATGYSSGLESSAASPPSHKPNITKPTGAV